MSFVNSPNMQFPVPTISNEPGPQYATDINQALYTIDSHNHSPGQGVPVGAQGIYLQSDLSFNVNNATTLRSARFVSTTASSGTDIGCLYVKGVDLFYNDLNANVVRLTLNGGLASTGIFVGVISTTAIISSNAGIPASSGFIRMDNNTDFVAWRNAANNADDKVYFDNTDTFQIGGNGPQANQFNLFDTGASKLVKLKASQSSSAYTLSLPVSPTTGGILQMDPTGQVSVNNTIRDSIQIGTSGMRLSYNPSIGTLLIDGAGSGLQLGSTAFAALNVTGDSMTLLAEAAGGIGRAIVVSQIPSTHGLMVIRGLVRASDSALLSGEGFTCSRVSTGFFRIAYTTPFLDPGVPSGNTGDGTSTWVSFFNISTTGCNVFIYNNLGNASDNNFSIFASGQRGS